MKLNEVIKMYIESGNVEYIENLVNAAILLYRKHGHVNLDRFCQAVILPEFGVDCALELYNMVVNLDSAIVSLRYAECNHNIVVEEGA